MDNVLTLHRELVAGTYKHGPYHAFKLSDPKPRDIHKAEVRDRLVHHAIYRQLYPFFDRTFIADSYSCRLGKGTHRAMDRFRTFAYQASNNHARTVWVLQCDIRKFFASIDHAVLLRILAEYIPDRRIMGLLQNIIASFSGVRQGIGLPLGNLTSQLFVNVYMNIFDQWVKHTVKARGYTRYADDFVIFSYDRSRLEAQIPRIADFLNNQLHLTLHPDKVHIRTVASGVDFLGWVHFLDHRVLRTKTKRRMMRTIENKRGNPHVLQSYLGLLRHGNTKMLQGTAERMSHCL